MSKKYFGMNKKVANLVYDVMLFSILHSSFIAPIQEIYFANSSSYDTLEYNASRIPLTEKKEAEQNFCSPAVASSCVSASRRVNITTSDRLLKPFSYYALLSDHAEGTIGVSKEFPLDDPSDNLFKINMTTLPTAEDRVLLSYELYGISDPNGVSKSINDRPALGGYLVKKQNSWSHQTEEIDVTSLKEGINKIMFTTPKGTDHTYKIKNLKVEIIKRNPSEITSKLVLNTKDISLQKDNSIYIKGFVKNTPTDNLKILVEGSELYQYANEFEGFVSLKKEDIARNFVVVSAYDGSHLVGQEIISLVLSVEADNVYPIEKEFISKTFDVKAFSASTHAIEGASIQLADSSMAVSKPISITALRKIDIAPMGSGMVNVTKGGKAFRFLPDGTKFNAPVKITLDYDTQLLPAGYGPKDIKTFYFDTDIKQWRSIKIDSVDTKKHTVTAITTHFTDYINGIIQAPESPETSGFTPTMMSDIKISDASSEVTLISPPEVSQKGSANISYPIKIPAGTKGMQPQLSVQYSNEGANGWLGQGWNIAIPAITIDTRWGIPLLDTTNETEMYSLNGEALMYPKIPVSSDSTDWMPNRHYDFIPNSTTYTTAARPRIANAVFTMRKEGTFMKIQRLGTSPSNYYWKVTNTDGTINWYGGKNGVDEHSVIKRDGKIVHWALFQTEDVFGNNIKYEYDDTVLSGLTGINANLNGGKIFNIKKIVYTGYNETPGKYEILFNRTTSIRNDVNITARLGVKQVEPYFLSNILVRNVSDSPTNFIRKYGFDITYGRFQKGRLVAIKEYGKNNTEFYRHEFEYYDALEDPKEYFSAPVTINVPSFNPDFNFLMNTALGSTSRINSSEATEYAWGARFGFGLQINRVSSDPSRLFTVGFPFGESYTKSKGKITLADMNGDGLDDVLFKSGNTLKYFPHKINTTDNSHYFDSDWKEIVNINNFSKTDGKTKTMFGESVDFRMRKLFAGKKRFKTNEETSIYITDGNGDMLPDIVNNKTVYFNTGLASNGTNTFSTSSKLTPNMVITAKALQIEPEEEENEGEKDIDYDMVRVWEAPYGGKITILDNIEFLPQSSESTIIYSIETTNPYLNNNMPFRVYLKEFNSFNTAENILIDDHNDYTPPLGIGLNSFPVFPGQKIYFRIHKNNVGPNDILKTNPSIIFDYQQYPHWPDQNGNTVGQYNYHDDFVLSDGPETIVPSTGSIAITWDDFYVDFLSDDITYKVIKETSDQNDVVTQTVLYQKQVLKNTSEVVYTPSNLLNYTIGNLSPDDIMSIRFEVTSNSNVRWQSAQWKPKFVYTPDSNAISQGFTNTITSYPVPSYSIFQEFGWNEYQLHSAGSPSSLVTNYWPLPSTFTTYSAMPNTDVHPLCPTPLGTNDNGVFSFVMKKDGLTIGRRLITINAGVITLDDYDPIPFYSGVASINNQPKVTFEFYVEGYQNSRVFEKYTKAVSFHPNYSDGVGNVVIGHQSEWDMQYGFDNYNHYWRFRAEANNNNKKFLGNMYRGWGQFLYNDALDVSSTPSDNFSKLINNNIINNFEANADLLTHVIGGIDIEDCVSSNVQAVSNCLEGQLNNSLNLPSENATIDDGNIDGIVDGSIGNLGISDLQRMLCLMTTYPFRTQTETEQIEKWIGLHDAQYSSDSESRNGNFIDSDFGSVFDEPTDIDSPELIADEHTGMIAQHRTQKSVAVGKSVGRGRLILSKSESRYSDNVSDFMDMNGDRYPDVMTSKKIQKTNMTGGHLDVNSGNDYGYSPLSGATNKASSIAYSGSYPIPGRKETDNKKSDNGNPSYSLGFSASVPLSGNNKGKETLADLNGDGLPDRIIIENNEYKYKLNLGNAFSGASADTYQNYEPYKTQPNRGISPSYSISGSFMDAGRFPFSVSAGYSTSESDTQTLLQDMNGDGLPDLVNFTGSGSGTVRYNLGNSFSSQQVALIHPNTSEFSLYKNIKSSSLSLSGSMSYFYGFPIFSTFFFTVFFKAGATVDGNANLTISETKKEFRDFNGDGYADMIEKNSNNLKVYYSNIGKTDMLKSVKNPLGGSFTMDYQVKPVNYNNPTAKWVMSELTIHDGYNKMNDGEDTYKKTFAYENGIYDRREREFYGYETVTVSDPTTFRTTVSKFHNQNYFLNGLLKESYVIKGNDENKKYSRTENTYEIKKLNDSNTGIVVSSNLPYTFDTGGTEGRRSAAVVLAKTNNYFYELAASPLLITEINFTYDSLGRIVTYQNKGEGNNASDNYTSTITYHDVPSLVSKNIIRIPKTIEVSSDANTMRSRSTIVDENTGNITELRAYLSSSAISSTFMQYDTYGNMTRITYPPNNNGDSAFYQYNYDSEYHKYIIKITDVFGNSTHTKYDSDFDKITETTDIAGNKAEYQYDVYGRNILVRGPKEIESYKPYTLTTSYYLKHSELPANSGVDATTFVPVSVTKHYDFLHPTNDIETYTFIDGLARPIQVKKDILLDMNNSHQDPSFNEALSVSGKTYYDEYGRAIKQYHPYYELKNANSVFLLNEHNSPYHASTFYDELDRPITSIDAAGNESFTEYSIDQDNFGIIAQKTKSTTDQNGSQSIITESYKDVFGRVISSMNAKAGGNIWTRFSYNAIGELLSYTDAENLSTIYTYDNLGRKTSIKHPDNGLTSYYYDKTGNVEKLQTANLAADTSLNPEERFIKYNYDYNRLIGINYPDTQGQPNISNITYIYGTSGNDKGRIIEQFDATGSQKFQYGNMGEVEHITRTIIGPNIPTRSFETNFIYDSWNRIIEMIYPDGEKIYYGYDFGGNLNKITGEVNGAPYDYIKRIHYDHYEQKTYQLYGNDTETSYTYSLELRRLDLLSAKTSAGESLFENAYSYDKVGNVVALENYSIPTSNLLGGTYFLYFGYDELNRLKFADGNFIGDGQIGNGNDFDSDYNLVMNYNTTHGITKKTQNHIKNLSTSLYAPNTYSNDYTYIKDSHMVEKIADSNSGNYEIFTYDLNGNMISRDKHKQPLKKYIWDESNRLRVVSDENSMQHYIYDANGDRVLKANTHSETVYENGMLTSPGSVTINGYTTYPSAYLVVDPQGVYSKHYFSGNQRIASQIGTGSTDIFLPRAMATNPKKVTDEKLQQIQIADLQKLAVLSNHKVSFAKNKPKKQETTEDSLEQKDQKQQRLTSTALLYFYHPDHLGTSTFLTDYNGNAYQFFLNLPFGETMAEQKSITEDYATPYKFNGKEFDEETSLYYYGARYYDPKISIWLSVDPLAEKAPSWTPYRYGFNNPIRFIDDTGMREEPTPYEAAVMSSHVYDGKIELVGGWQVSKFQTGIQYNNDKTGFKSALYERTVDGKTEYTYATAGTEDGKDWKANGAQMAGVSKQYSQSTSNAKELKKELNGAELTFTGHSLGGGLAEANATQTEGRAITFNAAGLSIFTKGVTKMSKTDAYILITDPLNGLQQASGPLVPKAGGKVHYLSPKSGSGTYNGHSINSVIESLSPKPGFWESIWNTVKQATTPPRFHH